LKLVSLDTSGVVWVNKESNPVSRLRSDYICWHSRLYSIPAMDWKISDVYLLFHAFNCIW